MDEHASGLYQGNTFHFKLQEDWQDQTVHLFHGPVTDGVQHNMTVNIDHEPQLDTLEEYAELQVRSVEEQLKSCRLLLHDEVQLNNGLPAVRAIFSWYPTDELRIYQEQLYVLAEGKGYTLTASFTKKTRITEGTWVERIMLSFAPHSEQPAQSDA